VQLTFILTPCLFRAVSATRQYFNVYTRLYQFKRKKVAHYPIPPLGVELGLWEGIYKNVELPWLRWWDNQGQLLPTPEEFALEQKQLAELEKQRAELEKQRAETEKQRAEQEKQCADLLAAKLRELGVNPDEL
jgi:hypothetical protein